MKLYGETSKGALNAIASVLEKKEPIQENVMVKYHNTMASRHASYADAHEREVSNGGHPDHDFASNDHHDAADAHKAAAAAAKKHGTSSSQYKSAESNAKKKTSLAKYTTSEAGKFKKVAKPKSLGEEDKLKGKQHKLDVDGDGDIEADDLAKLRAKKKKKKKENTDAKTQDNSSVTNNGKDEVDMDPEVDSKGMDEATTLYRVSGSNAQGNIQARDVNHATELAKKKGIKGKLNIQVHPHNKVNKSSVAETVVRSIKEISKATKSAYVQKATADIISKSMDMARGISSGDKKATDKAFNKVNKRSKGIQNITHKALYKNEEKLNELSPETLKRYKDAVDKKHTVKGVTRLTSTGQVQKFKDANQMHKRDTGVARATNRLNKK